MLTPFEKRFEFNNKVSLKECLAAKFKGGHSSYRTADLLGIDRQTVQKYGKIYGLDFELNNKNRRVRKEVMTPA
ncbi:MAG TPA: hypothetical protein VHZ76_00800 [Gammaproteobacteria bacterium]|jgi:hypothetical protein|nr:hypothetical protein [Gammaproteobacteria bacterium]